MPKLIDLTGYRLGRLKVIGKWNVHQCRNDTMWLCKCECGKEVIVRGSTLRNGQSKSCGCLRAEIHGSFFDKDKSNS